MNLLERRQQLYADMKALMDRAEAREDRSLTGDEYALYKRLEAEFDQLTEQMQDSRSQPVTLDPILQAMFNRQPGGDSRGFLTAEQRMQPSPSGLSLAKALRGMVTGDWRHAEAEQRALGIGANGAALVNDVLAGEVIDLARAKSGVIAAGALTYPMAAGTVKLPKLIADPAVAWRLEHAQIAETTPNFAAVTLTAKSLAALVKISVELLQDSPLAEDGVRTAIAQAMAAELDRAALRGSGTDPEPRGIRNVAGVNLVDLGANGSALTSYDPIIDAVTAIRSDNREPKAYILSPREQGTISKFKDSAGNYLTVPDVVATLRQVATSAVETTEPAGTAGNVGATIYVGDFSHCIIGIRQELTLVPLRERFADYGEVGILAILRADVAVTDPNAFALVTPVIP